MHLCFTTCYLLGLGLASSTKLAWLAWIGWAPWAAWGGLAWLTGWPARLFGVAGTAGWLAIWRISVYLDSSLFGQTFFLAPDRKKLILRPVFSNSSLFGQDPNRVYSATFEFIRPLSSLFGGRINSKVENLWRSVDSSLFGQLFDTCSPFEFIRPRQIRNFENTLDVQCFSTLSWWAPGIRVYSARGFEFIRPSFEFIRPVWPNKL